MPDWLKNARFYEIYPQSFYDFNGDGIGDVNGIREKLGYVKQLGFNAVWLNPLFVSPFMDAGYDVENYYEVAPRYGSNRDLVELFFEAHALGIKVLLDLVPGHTSDKCGWFERSKLPERNDMSDRYVWTKSVWDRPQLYNWVCGMTDRDGCYMVNFFNSQPALNYGFGEINFPEWQMSYTDKAVRANFDEILNVMRFWLDKGADGFRVDMADSLVKNDPDKKATAWLWQRARKMLDEEYPEAVMISEWCDAPKAVNEAGFHSDFVLQHNGTLTTEAFRQERAGGNAPFFSADSEKNFEKTFGRFLSDYKAIEGKGYMSLITGNHDVARLSEYLTPEETKLAFLCIFTLPNVPFVYYGDEIGMKYLKLRSKEGGYNRTGSRTPMQWNNGLNLGFSAADKSKLYLPVDNSKDAPNVDAETRDLESLLNFVKKLNTLRDSYRELQADASFKVVENGECGLPLIYSRGDNILVAINLYNKNAAVKVKTDKVLLTYKDVKVNADEIELPPMSAAVFTKNRN